MTINRKPDSSRARQHQHAKGYCVVGHALSAPPQNRHSSTQFHEAQPASALCCSLPFFSKPVRSKPFSSAYSRLDLNLKLLFKTLFSPSFSNSSPSLSRGILPLLTLCENQASSTYPIFREPDPCISSQRSPADETQDTLFDGQGTTIKCLLIPVTDAFACRVTASYRYSSS
jgi:hypothetical protein